MYCDNCHGGWLEFEEFPRETETGRELHFRICYCPKCGKVSSVYAE